MRDYIRRKISAAYLTDGSGTPVAIDIWDYLGTSLLFGATPALPLTVTDADGNPVALIDADSNPVTLQEA